VPTGLGARSLATATRTAKAIGPAAGEQALAARPLRRKALLKLQDRRRAGRPRHPSKLRNNTDGANGYARVAIYGGGAAGCRAMPSAPPEALPSRAMPDGATTPLPPWRPLGRRDGDEQLRADDHRGVMPIAMITERRHHQREVVRPPSRPSRGKGCASAPTAPFSGPSAAPGSMRRCAITGGRVGPVGRGGGGAVARARAPRAGAGGGEEAMRRRCTNPRQCRPGWRRSPVPGLARWPAVPSIGSTVRRPPVEIVEGRSAAGPAPSSSKMRWHFVRSIKMRLPRWLSRIAASTSGSKIGTYELAGHRAACRATAEDEARTVWLTMGVVMLD
jgi:hypothetical protein